MVCNDQYTSLAVTIKHSYILIIPGIYSVLNFDLQFIKIALY